MITFEEFKKMELKTGKIVSVENHPNADKLYIIKIDLGDSQKQSVAGLKPYFQPEELLNKTVAVVTNIQPGNLRGVESQVMILVINVSKENVVLLTPDKEVPIGAPIY
ncbi:MAG: tRNA-binding protein [Planctomycetes bacterium]|nr:tRNA-binding protein [Planctomycetota bacterium]